MLQSARLTFRPCADADLAILLAHWGDSQVRRFLFDDRQVEPDQVETFIRTSEALFQAHQYGLWFLADRTAHQFCGVCGLWQGELDQPELLVSIVPVKWGQGLGTEAGQTVLHYGFEQCRLPEVVATVDPPNRASIRMLEKLGFRQSHQPQHTGTLLFICDRASCV
ncbi:MAG: GNAT family N-acetyltransferase [Elainella sp.]